MAEHWNGGSGGKGDKPRPFNITQEEYDNRWDAIFQRDLKETKEDKAAYFAKLNAETKARMEAKDTALEDGFDLESLDPAERSWYYDDHGVRRKKKD